MQDPNKQQQQAGGDIAVSTTAPHQQQPQQAQQQNGGGSGGAAVSTTPVTTTTTTTAAAQPQQSQQQPRVTAVLTTAPNANGKFCSSISSNFIINNNFKKTGWRPALPPQQQLQQNATATNAGGYVYPQTMQPQVVPSNQAVCVLPPQLQQSTFYYPAMEWCLFCDKYFESRRSLVFHIYHYHM